MPVRDELTGELIAALRRDGIDVAAGSLRPVVGGSISSAFRVPTAGGAVLVKLAPTASLERLDAEADGLEALRAASALAVPRVLGRGRAGAQAYLALEWIDFVAKSGAAESRLGRGLALQHRRTAAEFGWHRDNFIGTTPQRNDRRGDWPGFFRDLRLGEQLERACRNALPPECAKVGADVLNGIERFFDGDRPVPSLVHGDLWAGNWGAAANGDPYVYDPAVYYGDREADLAMTRLFGGFGAAFYAAYEEAWPLDAGWERRVDLYNLYHLLNHFNLFGHGYAAAVAAALRRVARAP